MSLPRFGSETEIIDRRVEMKLIRGKVDDKTFEDTLNRFDKLNSIPILFGRYPEVIPESDIPYTSPLAEDKSKTEETKDWRRSCGICGGNHDHDVCEFRRRCRFDQKVGEDFQVYCLCSVPDCTERCSYPFGKAAHKQSYILSILPKFAHG
ncbi:hypothetical protein CASFOL_026407 [Castilleja foliolosa]|uniref:Uncharacterized protein n=1 Tax=Castilleja foliolosa TaxID=1961234 RepID=A0ABD3CKB0_9LAMI